MSKVNGFIWIERPSSPQRMAAAPYAGMSDAANSEAKPRD